MRNEAKVAMLQKKSSLQICKVASEINANLKNEPEIKTNPQN